MLRRRQLALLGGGVLAMPWVKSAKAAWPVDRAIEVIVPFPPGGGVDAVARFATHQVTPRLPGVRFVISNRPGASGQLGMEAIFNAAPDGYTLGTIGSLNVSTLPLEREDFLVPLLTTSGKMKSTPLMTRPSCKNPLPGGN